jgi:Family of unknown function (DUF5706)
MYVPLNLGGLSMDALVEKLRVIFQNVNEWLKFAEAKNAVLLAFSGTAMTATLAVLATVQNLPNSLRVGLLGATVLLCVCAFFCAWSFLPKTNLEKILWSRSNSFQAMKPQVEDNLYYFGHLRKYNSATLLDSVNQGYLNGAASLPYGKEAQDLASQIVVNASIAFRKYQFFTYGAYCLVISILIVPTSILFNLVFFKGL